MKENRPNIILILADDMGYSDIGCFGSEIATTNIDRLSENGVIFSQAYNCARCCPSRASLLTGLYPHQSGVGHMVANLEHPSYLGYLNDRCVTLAEVLRSGGYHTIMSGKWHVGGGYDVKNPETWSPGDEGHPIPTTRGFERFYGTLAGCADYFNPHTLMRDESFVEPQGEPYYYTDAISEEGSRLIREYSRRENPFFLYLAYTAPHWPLHAMPEDIARYEGRYLRGWDGIRTARHESLIELGILDRKWQISPRDRSALPWEEVEQKDWEDRRMAVYAAQVDRMDQGIGKIVATVRELGLEEDTLIMFLSDNGGCAEFLAEDGFVQNVLWPMRNGKQVRAGNFPGVMPGSEDTYMSYDLPWANASNTPFRLYKHWVHEGGIATPLVVSWPSVIKKRRVVHEPTHVIDIMATLVDAAGVEYPQSFDGREITPLEGESFIPALRGKDWTREKPLYWEHEGNCAIRQENWKLVRKYPGDWELYNLEQDRTELVDLREKNKPKAEQLRKLHERWSERCDILPMERLKELAPIEDIPTEE
jgi:arylsulfatase